MPSFDLNKYKTVCFYAFYHNESVTCPVFHSTRFARDYETNNTNRVKRKCKLEHVNVMRITFMFYAASDKVSLFHNVFYPEATVARTLDHPRRKK